MVTLTATALSSIKIYDVREATLREAFAIEKISFVSAHPSEKHVFCIITVNDTVRPVIFNCHVFKSDKKVRTTVRRSLASYPV